MSLSCMHKLEARMSDQHVAFMSYKQIIILCTFGWVSSTPGQMLALTVLLFADQESNETEEIFPFFAFQYEQRSSWKQPWGISQVLLTCRTETVAVSPFTNDCRPQIASPPELSHAHAGASSVLLVFIILHVASWTAGLDTGCCHM